MSITDDLDSAEAEASRPTYQKGWEPRVTEGSYEAEAVSTAFFDGDSPDEAMLIEAWGLDPTWWSIIPGTLLVNRWQGMRGKKFDNEPVWLYQYKARLNRRIDPNNLPMGLNISPNFNVRVSGRGGAKKKWELPGGDWGVGIFYPDPQFGYWWDERGEIHTIHDERCFDIRNQVMMDVRSAYGKIDKVVGAGDTDDFTHFSRFTSTPNYVERTLQPTLDRTSLEWQQLRAICPDRENEIIQVLDGNHDNPRLITSLISKGLGVLVGIRQGGSPYETDPVLSLQHLTQTEKWGIEYVEPFPQASVEFNESLGCAHGPAYSSKKLGTATAILAKTRRSMLFGHCFDDQTEILTPDGWKTHETLTNDSVVMTLNRDSDALEWNMVNEVFRYDDFDELVSIQNKNIDLKVTGGHGLYTAPQGGEYRETTADESFGKAHEFLLAGTHDQEHLPLSDDFIRFIAWVLTDGSIDKWGNVRIAQSDQLDGRIEELETVLDAIGVGYSKILHYKAGETRHGTYHNFDAYGFTLHAGDYRELLSKYVDKNKTPLNPIRGMSVTQMRIFLSSWIDGDGSRLEHDSVQSSSIRKDHIDLLQEFACRSGYRSSMYPYQTCDGKTLWRITINPRSETRVSKKSWTREEYQGTVWCVSVPNGTLLVRRNGKTAITLNTHREENMAVTLWTENGPRTYYVGSPGTFCRTDMVVPSTSAKPTSRGTPAVGIGTEDWQAGFNIVMFEKGGGNHFEIESVRIWGGKANEGSVAYWRGKKYSSTCDADGNVLSDDERR